jgi:hypothetical protein
MFRKSHLLEIGSIYRFRYSQDFDLLLRLASKYRIGSIEKILYRYREGSPLQKNFILNLKRKSQCDFLLNAYLNGRLFDDNYCINKVEQIYNEDYRNRFANKDAVNFEISKSRMFLKVLFAQGKNQELRSTTRSLIRKYGLKQIYLQYLVLSILPVRIARLFVDISIVIKRCISRTSIRFLTMTELYNFNRISNE